MWPTVYIIIRKNEFKVRRSKKLQIYSFLLSFFIEVFYLLPYCSCFISIFSLPSILSPSLTISHIFFPLISFPSPHSHLLPFPSLISPFLSFPSLSSPPLPSLSCHLLSYHVISFPSFPLRSSPLTSFHLLSHHFISFYRIGDYSPQINSSSGSGSSSNFSHLFDWVKIAHR